MFKNAAAIQMTRELDNCVPLFIQFPTFSYRFMNCLHSHTIFLTARTLGDVPAATHSIQLNLENVNGALYCKDMLNPGTLFVLRRLIDTEKFVEGWDVRGL